METAYLVILIAAVVAVGVIAAYAVVKLVAKR
jgi:hypothetical protein